MRADTNITHTMVQLKPIPTLQANIILILQASHDFFVTLVVVEQVPMITTNTSPLHELQTTLISNPPPKYQADEKCMIEHLFPIEEHYSEILLYLTIYAMIDFSISLE